MSSIIIVLPKLEDAKQIKDILALLHVVCDHTDSCCTLHNSFHGAFTGTPARQRCRDLQLSDQGHALYTAGGISARLF